MARGPWIWRWPTLAVGLPVGAPVAQGRSPYDGLEARDHKALSAGCVAAIEVGIRAGDVPREVREDSVMRSAESRGRLRSIHLPRHLETVALLAPGQVARSAELHGHDPRAAAPAGRDPALWRRLRALAIAVRRFEALLPSFLTMLVAVSLVLALVPEAAIARVLGGDDRFVATLVGAIVGSIALMPAFVAFPLAGILLERGVAYMVISAFMTTLMMVGVLTYPIERRVLGHRVTLLRNALSLLVALTVAVATGVWFGEVP